MIVADHHSALAFVGFFFWLGIVVLLLGMGFGSTTAVQIGFGIIIASVLIIFAGVALFALAVLLGGAVFIIVLLVLLAMGVVALLGHGCA